MILTDDEVRRSLAIIEDAKLLIPLAEQALSDLLAHRAAGGPIPGYKIVRTYARNRAWRHEGHARKKLLEAGLTEDQICEPRRLKTPHAIEQLAPLLPVDALTWKPQRSLSVEPVSSDSDEVTF